MSQQTQDGVCITFPTINNRLRDEYGSPFLRRYLPDNVATELLTEDNVKRTLEEAKVSQAGDSSDLSEYIIREAGNIFLTLVYVEHVQSILDFKSQGFTKNKLPACLARSPSVSKRPWNKPRSKFDFQQTTLREKGCQDFEKDQWIFLAPKIQVGKFKILEFNPLQPLPYLNPGSSISPTAQLGGFGSVRKVALDEAHRQGEHSYFTGNGDFLVAIKTMRVDSVQFTDVVKFYDREKKTLEFLTKLKHPHLIQAIAAYKRSDDRCFILPWAEGGNLKQFWANHETKPDRNLVAWALAQMAGIACGIKELQKKNIRHGDLKPENILHFQKDRGHGMLVVADVGLAKFHPDYTTERHLRTTTQHWTVFYEPPEITTHKHKPVSRRVDLWSLGCVFLEFTIWIKSGNRGLQKFEEDIRGSGDRAFWKPTGSNGAEIHPVVLNWISEKLKTASELDSPPSPIRRLVDLITEHLLVIDKKERRIDRAVDKLEALKSEYEYRPDNETGLVPVDADNSAYNPANLSKQYVRKISLIISGFIKNTELKLRRQRTQHTSKLNDRWVNATDNELAKTILSRLDWLSLRPTSQGLGCCDLCRNFDFLSPEWNVYIATGGSEECSLCSFFSECLSRIDSNLIGSVTLFRDDVFKVLRLSPDGLPVMSLYSDPIESSPISLQYTQTGLPILPSVGSVDFFKVLNRWIFLCNNSHCCLSAQFEPGCTGNVPTRLIYVGDGESSPLHLVETNGVHRAWYVALSHCWGAFSGKTTISLQSGNLKAFKRSIPQSTLPRSFQDAIRVTRAIKIPYLWIDSLCIIQDDANDWETEAGRMEDVFRFAYCTIAATSASSSAEGFLNRRKSRASIGVKTSRGPLYISEAIDNFEADVERGILNSRGWVFQERALSCRTVHFTSTQMYWECGHGIYCETLAQYRNPRSQILGDANFPNSGLLYYKDERIRLIQYLYQTYSALNLTKGTDRSKAILGLEKRLSRAFNSAASYGVIWKFFERMLLWQAEVPGGLVRLSYPSGEVIPSWSWMASSGNIRYMDIPFGSVSWLQNIYIPFQNSVIKIGWNGTLLANANELLLEDGLSPSEGAFLDFDDCQYNSKTWKCVILGRVNSAKGSATAFFHYVIFVRAVSSEKDCETFQRVGVGCLAGLHLSKQSVKIRII